jgi:hypothetical protein
MGKYSGGSGKTYTGLSDSDRLLRVVEGMEAVSKCLKNLDERMERLEKQVGISNENSQKMVEHVGLVERVWKQFKGPAFVFANVANRLAGVFTSSVDATQLEYACDDACESPR